MIITDKNYTDFKCLLEYFIAHLEAYNRIVTNKNYAKEGQSKGSVSHESIKVKLKELPKEVVGESHRGFSILKLATNQGENQMVWSGQSFKNGSIDNQIRRWNTLNALMRIGIAIETSNFSFSKENLYLHWLSTSINIKVQDSDETEIISLSIKDAKQNFILKTASISDLGLFNNQQPNEKLIQFYNEYVAFGAKELLGKMSYNTILSGAPGTGKTYLAKEIAKAITGDSNDNNHPHYEMVQFHPSYDYSDFVEGLRPMKVAQGTIGFERKDGVFKAFCRKALKNGYDMTEKGWQYKGESSPKYVFIIDEINRGEMSKIFGELFFSIDPGYRGVKGAIKTQYANLNDEPNEFDKALGIKEHAFPYSDAEKENFGHFFVPENVYIIGTMNDIDRSVESMDFAMRRRFTFKEVTATSRIDMWDGNIDNWKDKAEMKMKAINAVIELIPGLNKAYHIGPSYFMRIQELNGDWDELWNSNLKGLVAEYLRGMPDAEERLVNVWDAYNNA